MVGILLVVLLCVCILGKFLKNMSQSQSKSRFNNNTFGWETEGRNGNNNYFGEYEDDYYEGESAALLGGYY
jgi:hypothetical protein